jgi:hypothetical protein
MDVHGDRLANPAPDGLAIWDTVAMKRLANFDMAERSYCFLRDGTLAIFVVPEGSEHCVFYRIDAAGQRRTVYGPSYRYDNYNGQLLASPRDDEYYLLEESQIHIYTEAKGRAERTSRIDLPRGSGTNRSLVRSLSDGRILTGDGAFTVLSRDGTATKHRARRVPTHLAMISDDQLWYSYAELGADRVARITRLGLTAPEPSAPIIELEKEHVVYLACAPSGALAALVFWVDYEAERPQALNWDVIVYSAEGALRWRRTALQSGERADFELSETLDIAMTEQRVIFRGKRGALLAWDVATGDPISVS